MNKRYFLMIKGTVDGSDILYSNTVEISYGCLEIIRKVGQAIIDIGETDENFPFDNEEVYTLYQNELSDVEIYFIGERLPHDSNYNAINHISKMEIIVSDTVLNALIL